jgi:Spy/CpxP family protein refolding chaperone
MRTLKLTLAVAALTLSTVICQAQSQGGHPGKQEKGAKIVEKLGLSKEQAEKLKAINASQKIENKAFQEKMNPVKEQMKALKAEKKAMNAAKMKEIEAILTPEQFVKFKEMKEQRKDNRKGKKQKH